VLGYEVGQDVTIQLGSSMYWGRITALSANSAEVTFPVQLDLGESEGLLTWPDGLGQEVSLPDLNHHTNLVVRIPLALIPRPKPEEPAPPAVIAPEGVILPQIQAEMRRSVRVPLELDVTLTDPASMIQVTGRTFDLSGGGAKLSSQSILMVGREYLVGLPLEDPPIEVRARVLRRLGHQIYALKFLAGRETGHQIMRALFSRIRGDQPASRPRSMNFRKNP
jgi:hypothetical protein